MSKRGTYQLVLGLSIVALLLVGRLRAQGQPEAAADTTAHTDIVQTDQPADTIRATTPAAIVVLAGDINPYNLQQMERRFATAREAGARTVIFSIDTFGGYVDSGLAISRFIKRQTDLHIIAYIPEKAISAGAMIAVACDEIVMESGSMIGNSGVVTGTGQELTGTARAKAESMVLEDFRDSAARNNYPTLLMEAMIVVERQVHWVEHVETEERRFVDAATYQTLIGTELWRPVPNVRDPIDAEDTLLTLGAELAHTLGIASEIAPDVRSFAASRGLDIVAEVAPTSGDQIVGFLNSFMVRGLLMTVFMFSLYMSFSTPGTGLPEMILVLSLTVLLGVPLLTGYATWYEIVAILLGVALIALEIFILPGFGLPGITGVLLILAGLTMTFVPPIRLPDDVDISFAIPWVMVQKAALMVFASLAASLLLMMWAAKYLPKSTRFGRLILTATAGGTEGGPVLADIPAPFQQVAWPHSGAVGVAVSDLRPFGSAEFQDDLINDTRTVDVYSDSGFIRRGAKVKVHRVQGSRVVVKPV